VLCKVFALESGLLVRASSLLKGRTEMPCIREERSPGVSILHISGPLRVPLSSDLELVVHAVLRRGVRRIELNLAAVSDLDAGGVGTLVQLYNLAAGAHCVLRIVSTPARVQELLCKAGLFDLLTKEARWWWPQAV
jgi:anti-anti-sigma factor